MRHLSLSFTDLCFWNQAQIRALIEDDDTLETLSDPIPLKTALNAIDWAALEKTATWHRKVALCLRCLTYANESIPYFEKAVQMDYSYVQARGGLAELYRQRQYFSKVIDLELVNASILVERLKECNDNDDRFLRKELAISYDAIAYSHQKIDDIPTALRFWKKSAETLEIAPWGIFEYLRLLSASTKESRWSEAIALLKLLESSCTNAKSLNRLTDYILSSPFPGEGSDELFTVATEAAKRENCMPWLIEAYQTAIAYAKKHVTVVELKLCIVDIHRKFTKDYAAAESFIEQLMEIALLDEENKIRELEDCKDIIGRDYACIYVRKAMLAGPHSADMDHSIHSLSRFCSSGVDPRKQRQLCLYVDLKILFLAILQRGSGSLLDARHTLGTYLIEACMFALDIIRGPFRLYSLIFALIAAGDQVDALWFMEKIRSQMRWLCGQCSTIAESGGDIAICEYCLVTFCGNCFSRPPVGFSRFCVPGHRLVKLSTSSSGALFRGQEHTISQAVRVVLAETREFMGVGAPGPRL